MAYEAGPTGFGLARALSVAGIRCEITVCSWLTPAVMLQHWWKAWSNTPPPTRLQDLINAVSHGRQLNLYLAPPY
ncbi:hypothetical protein GCM10010245_90520 [Streptomyces spectabilis]|uniref:Transposase n=1 Tax=Streptomyces spectabilis TaxID=68270 RepID=A0A7W8F024_STRST|nr:hypothetical protein [Streptomyces spectabilis]GGV57432.1 hypothetical protein GCM10010245_90520 [Streptomyces spectabilis]